MDKPQRYELQLEYGCWSGDVIGAAMKPLKKTKSGGWIPYSEYEKLEQRNAELERIIRSIEYGTCKWFRTEHGCPQAERVGPIDDHC